MKRVSVVIPTYQRTLLLAKCLEALAGQTFDLQYAEIIVVSDGPDPHTKSLVDLFITRKLKNLTYIALGHKKGPAAARNAGWHKATADLIAFTDDDCMPQTDWLASLVLAREKCRDEAAAFSGKIIVPRSSAPTDYECNVAQLEHAEFVTANCACTRRALMQVNGFDEAFTMAWREDSDLQFNFLLHGIPIHRVPDARVVHPVRSAPWGISVSEERKGIFNALLYKKYPQLYKEKIQPQRPWLYYVIILSFIVLFAGLATDSLALSLVSFLCWLLLTIRFFIKRMKNTSTSAAHIAEMIVTSVIIPFPSIFWRIYGALRFRVLFV
jgi:GT2 family glycosyltransferase